jgi:hypothetical protein
MMEDCMSNSKINLEMSDFRDMDLEHAQEVEIEKVRHLLVSHDPKMREEGLALLDAGCRKSRYLYDNDREKWEEIYGN